ncbi:MAG: hypothetical protein E7L01_26460 [Paenibacillus macerans]|uniref:Uncharacterized protein n=1 Tax=Paenibacillus macerans TaxID=44252 RepID=A0A6N8EWU3_PAEMA|nr:hypothetical protein [Paenibacillus macerans]MDU5948365.1 hypothetical protein [Paenibacillus macerans]MDU7476856.1 hypothetical protein [Paenibacillus macerans]MUG24547.1 hypothetical protein [Paenibacillus macerans]UMV45713.1 hypothetical protein LMZ02_19625 [Paenibacillus macerans]
MSKYGQAAVKAAELLNRGVTNSPAKAWDIATSELFGAGTWGQKKGCPKNAFLGLCEEGYIKGVSKALYNTKRNSKNKNYAIKATELIKAQPDLLEDLKELWNKATNGRGMSHNHQMDVVKALYMKKYINEP